MTTGILAFLTALLVGLPQILQALESHWAAKSAKEEADDIQVDRALSGNLDRTNAFSSRVFDEAKHSVDTKRT